MSVYIKQDMKKTICSIIVLLYAFGVSGQIPLDKPSPWQKQDFKAKRISSWNQKEAINHDWLIVKKGERAQLADIEGPSVISHIWCAVDNLFEVKDTMFLRKNSLEIYWDGLDYPSVRVPLGDFFGIGHGKVRSYSSEWFDMSINEGERRGALSSWVKMPFNKRAKIFLVNESEVDTRIFYYIDYQEYKKPFKKPYYFHCSWKAEMPTKPVSYDSGKKGENNYVILETEGEGNYLGCNLSIDNFTGGWWGEGDDMIYVDGEAFPPALHGTGSEDYFNHAWGMQDNCFPYAGTSWFNHAHNNWDGLWTMYRFHIKDPVSFTKNIRVTIEHGCHNERSDDYSSTAYWYQWPIVEAPVLPAVKGRITRIHERNDRKELLNNNLP